MPTAEERLLDATLVSIHRHGIAETSVGRVAEIAGLSRGMVRHVFGSKDAMIVAAMKRVCDQWVGLTRPDPTLSGPVQVRAIVAAMFSPEVFTPVNLDAWLELSTLGKSIPAVAELREDTNSAWQAHLTSAFQAAGHPTPEDAASALLAAADGLWIRSRRDDAIDRQGVERIALFTADALLA